MAAKKVRGNFIFALARTLPPNPLRPETSRESAAGGSNVNALVVTTVGDLIAALFDETDLLDGVDSGERGLLVAYLLNDLLRRSARRRERPRQSFPLAVLSRRAVRA